MCGIAGIVRLDPRDVVDDARLKRMRDVLRHRGPDGEGAWIEGPVGLAHRRLAIVDVEGGHQPMASEDDSAWIVCNGEIYNHPRLRPALEARGHRYRTRSDTETILHLYEERGAECVEALDGMFAFALWDRARGRLLLARDRLGIKPLYVAHTAHELLFASEIKALLAALPGRAELDDDALAEFLANGFVAGGATLFRGIRALPPARMLSWSAATGVEERRYWALPAGLDGEPRDLAAAARDVRAMLEASVASQLMSDVPLGLFLSGGVDSTGLAALAARRLGEPLRTFAVGFAETDADERPYARLAARAVGARHREVVVSAAEFAAALPRLVWHEDEPLAFPSSVALHFVSRLAAEDVKVVLTGEGADELFLGYNRYRVAAWNARLGAAWARAVPAPLRRRAQRLLGALPPTARRHADRTFLARGADARELFCDAFAVFSAALRRRILAPARRREPRDPHAAALRAYAAAPGGPLTRMSHADLQTYLVELLMKQDQMSMSASVESRVPFLDHRLVERIVTLPESLKVRGARTKVVLRAALADVVPAAILRRRKRGFPVPLARWLRGPLQPLVAEFVLGPRALARGLFDGEALAHVAAEHARGAGHHADRLWLLVNLELWQRIFLDGEDPADVARAATGAPR